MIKLDRRRAVISAAGFAVGGMATTRLLPEEMLLRDCRSVRPRVAILSATGYSDGLGECVTQALRLFGLPIRDRAVLLKPNLVEYIPGFEVNTNPILVGADAEAFLKLGARWRKDRATSGTLT
ncbi:MAG: hypothetical protein ACR2NN_04610 [Bryobacteraceae bacterium]